MLIKVETAQPISIFLNQKVSKEGEKYLRILTGDLKNEMLAPSGTPIHLSVKIAKLFRAACFFFYQVTTPPGKMRVKGTLQWFR